MIGVDRFLYQNTNTIQQNRKYKIVEEEGGFDFPVLHGELFKVVFF